MGFAAQGLPAGDVTANLFKVSLNGVSGGVMGSVVQSLIRHESDEPDRPPATIFFHDPRLDRPATFCCICNKRWSPLEPGGAARLYSQFALSP
jgi:hypothetical protein